MHYLRLAIKSISELIRNQKLIFVIVILGLVVSEIGFEYFAGFQNGVYLERIKNQTKLRTYPVMNLDNSMYYNLIEVIPQNSAFKVEEIIVETEKVEIGANKARIFSYMTGKVPAFYSDGSGLKVISSNKEKPKCFISMNFVDISKVLNNIGLVLQINRNEFEIEAIFEPLSDMGDDPLVVIPFNKVKEVNAKYKSVSIITDKILSDKEFAFFESAIKKISNKAVINKNRKYDKETVEEISSKYIQRIALFLLLASMSIVNSLLLLKFWLSKKEKEILCYSIYGATSKQIFLLTFIEIISLVIGTEILAVVIFEMLARKAFLIIGIELVMGIKEYIISSLLSLTVASVTVAAMVLNTIKKLDFRRYTE